MPHSDGQSPILADKDPMLFTFTVSERLLARAQTGTAPVFAGLVPTLLLLQQRRPTLIAEGVLDEAFHRLLTSVCDTDWLRFARQLAFYATPAYVPFLREGAPVTGLPSSIYGPHVAIYGADNTLTMGPYRTGPHGSTFHPQHGFVGPDGEPSHLSFGPVNGPNPVTEFERACFGALL